MTLKEAKEILRKLAVKGSGWRIVDDCEACQLGIEAIKALQTHRTLGYPGLNFLLPGETKD